MLEADSLKTILRRNSITDGSRRENSGEHSWHLALMALVLAPYSAEPIDVGRVVEMLLVHDLVEIDAGDTFVYDTDAAAQKEELEQRAADRLFAIVPGDDGLGCGRAGTSTRRMTPRPGSRTRSTGSRPYCSITRTTASCGPSTGSPPSGRVHELTHEDRGRLPGLVGRGPRRSSTTPSATNGLPSRRTLAVCTGRSPRDRGWPVPVRGAGSPVVGSVRPRPPVGRAPPRRGRDHLCAVRRDRDRGRRRRDPIGQVGPHRLVPWPHRLGPLLLVVLAVALVGALAAVIAALASNGLAARALRLANARPLADGEAEPARRYIASFALGVGFPTPSVGAVEDPAPNAFAIGRRGACVVVCLTTGALRLPPDQLDASARR